MATNEYAKDSKLQVALVQFSSGDGPVECQMAVTKISEIFVKNATAQDLSCFVVEQDAEKTTATSKCYRSVVLQCKGEATKIEKLVSQWQGSVQWICQSPVRKNHKRKNWFIGCDIWLMDDQKSENIGTAGSFGEIRYETCKAGGPGGQHVNKTESAIRATHLESGISVRVQTERSQHANKKLADFLIRKKLQLQAEQKQAEFDTTKHKARKQVERGNPIRIFYGEKFIQKNKS